MTTFDFWQLFATENDKDEAVRAFIHVDSKSRAVQAMESARKIGKSDLSSLDIELKKAEDLLLEISKEIDFSRRQEILLRETAGTKCVVDHKRSNFVVWD